MINSVLAGSPTAHVYFMTSSNRGTYHFAPVSTGLSTVVREFNIK